MATMTKVQKFTAIANALTANGIAFDGFDAQDFLAKEIASVNKKNARKSDKPTKAQTANAEMFDNIVKTLTANGGTMTAKAVAETFGVTSQKISGVIKANDKNAVIARAKTKDGVTYTVTSPVQD